MAANAYDIADRRMGVNYRLNKVRFLRQSRSAAGCAATSSSLEYKPIEGARS